MKIVIVGCGRVGAGLVRALGRHDRELVVIDCDAAVFEHLGEAARTERIVGDAIDHDVLTNAGIGGADALAAVTGRDAINTVVARLAARRFGVPRVVARIYDPRTAVLYERLGVRTISPVTWGIDRLAELVTFTDVGSVRTVGSGGVEMVEAPVPARLTGRPIGELEAPGEIRVVAVSRDGRAHIATPQMHFESGDVAHLAVRSDAVEQVAELLGR